MRITQLFGVLLALYVAAGHAENWQPLALDDRLSSADVVSKAIYGACQPLLIPMMEQSREFMEGAMPGLIGAVLEYRKQAQRPKNPKSKPKPGAVQT